MSAVMGWREEMGRSYSATAARGGDDAMSARWRRAIFSNPIRMSAARTHGESGLLPHRALRRCATTGAGRRREPRMRSAGRTRFQLTPDSVRGERMRRYAPQGGAAVDAVLESASGGAPRRICIVACVPDAVGG